MAPISFVVEGARCSGRLWLPAAPSRLAAVVLANGFSGTQDWIVPDFAARFAAAGLAALVFDYRHLGESEGEPRQLVDVRRQRADLRAAIAFLRGHAAIDPDRIALWGTSLGGSHVVEVAAGDPRVAAVVATMPALDALRGANFDAKRERAGTSRAQALAATLQLMAAAVDDRLRAAWGRPPRYLDVYGAPGRAFFADPALAQRFRIVAASSHLWQNRIAARFLLAPPRYRAGTLERIRVPMLFSLAADDVEVSPAFIRRVAGGRPNCRTQEYPAGHFDLYHGAWFDVVAADQATFLTEALLTPRNL